MTYTLGAAARATGLSKSTIHRAIKAGRISAGRTEKGERIIDPAELHRVFPPAELNETEDRNGSTHGDAIDLEQSELAIRNARLQAEVNSSFQLSALLRQQLDETREDRDRWRSQAERLALPPPPSRAVDVKLSNSTQQRSGFVAWLFGHA